MDADIKTKSLWLRNIIHSAEDDCRAMMDDDVFGGEQRFHNQHSEMKANIMLAVRHLEDARMRLGKLCQYAEDGVSILDKPPYVDNAKDKP